VVAPQLNLEAPGELVSYLRETGRVGARETPKVRPLAGGVSNRTVLVAREGGEAWVFKQALPKLRVEVDWFSDPSRIRKEALGLRWLAELAPPGTVPELVFEDHAHHLLAMRAVPQPHENLKTVLLEGRVKRAHVEQLGRLLGTVHRRGFERRAEVAPVFEDRSFFETLRLEPYYAYTATRVPEAASFLTQLIEETRAHRLSLVHGDYSPKNVLVQGGRLVLLDFEVIHFGDPSFDLGFCLTHLLSKAHHLPPHREAFAEAARVLWRAYLEALGEPPWREGLEARTVRQTLGCLLARVAGRSRLEYLTGEACARQQEAVLALTPKPPESLGELIESFLRRLSCPPSST